MAMNISKERDWPIIFAFAAVYIIWGSTYLAIYYAIQSLPPMLLGGMRFIIVGCLLFIFTKWIKKEKYDRALWKFGLISGFMIFLIAGAAVMIAEKHLSSGLVSIIASIMPFQMLVLDYRSGPARFKNGWTWMGLIFGFIGVVILFYDKIIPQDGKPGEWFSYVIMLIGTLGWTSGSLYSKYTTIKASTNAKVCVQTFTAGLLFFIVAVPVGEYQDFHFSSVTPTSWIALIYLITFQETIVD